MVIERGVLKSYLLNTYTALKLGLKTTGNASRGLAGAAGVGPGNFYIEAGSRSEGDLIAGVRQGLYVTELIDSANTVTGDYSSGAAGLWIENGELTYPVSEITIAGNMKQMLMNLEQVGANLEFRSSIASPSAPDRGDDHQWPVIIHFGCRAAQASCVRAAAGRADRAGTRRRWSDRLSGACPTKPAAEAPLTPEARAYIKNLQLGDVGMKAAKNFSARWWWKSRAT